VENLPLASIAEAEAASRNDRYMTPLMTAKQIQVLVKDSMDLHINATNNPHMTTKSQVGLSAVQNYGLATQAEAEAGLIATAYMTPLMTRKAIEAIATGSIGAHLADSNNPHATTKTQVGLGSVQNYSVASTVEAELGESNIRYMTPLLVKAAIDAQVGGGIGDHVANISNPHQVTAAQVGTYTSGALDIKFDEKLNKLDPATDSAKLGGHTYDEVLEAAQSQLADDSAKLGGQTLQQIIDTITADGVDNATKLEGKSLDEVSDYIDGRIPYTKQYRVPDYEYTPGGSAVYVPLITATPDLGVDHEDIVVLINGLIEYGDLGTTSMLRINFVADVAQVIVLSGQAKTVDLVWSHVGGVVRVWLRTLDEHCGTNITILSGKKFTYLDPAATVLTSLPANSADVPVLEFTTDAEHQTTLTSLTTAFDTMNTTLAAFG
jgi:hypothetical protein